MALLPILRESTIVGTRITRALFPQIPQIPPVPNEAILPLSFAKPMILNFSMQSRRRALQEKVKNSLKPNAPDTKPDHFLEEREELKAKRVTSVANYSNTNVQTNTVSVEDIVTIIDIDWAGINRGIKAIELPFIPKELNWNSESTFVGIKPMGRNNPKYHFTGSEDTLEFEVDWHSLDSKRDDVIMKCRLLEALSKNDGYNNPPHRVLLQWGKDDILFRDMVFIVTSAPYRMTRFNKAQILNGDIQNTHLLPVQAYQKITLARITDNNLTSEQIRLVSI